MAFDKAFCFAGAVAAGIGSINAAQYGMTGWAGALLLAAWINVFLALWFWNGYLLEDKARLMKDLVELAQENGRLAATLREQVVKTETALVRATRAEQILDRATSRHEEAGETI